MGKFLFLINFLIITQVFNLQLGSLFACPSYVDPPKTIKLNDSYAFFPEKDGKKYSIVNVNKRVFIKEDISVPHLAEWYNYKGYCPKDFIFPTKETYESLIKELGKNASSILTDPQGFYMKENVYYLTSNYTKTTNYNYYYMFIENGKVKVEEKDPRTFGYTKIRIRCIFVPPYANLTYPNDKEDIEYKGSTTITHNSQYFNGVLWRYNKTLYSTSSLKLKFNESGGHKVEFWGQLITNQIVYLCEFIYVKKKPISSSQPYNDNIVKKIVTDFDMRYYNYIHFTPGNSHVAPRIDGGYYVAFVDTLKFLNILSYDKNDNLLKHFNTTELSDVFDITATDYGFVYYGRDSRSSYHSFMKLYNKNFELINTVQIMNNTKDDDVTVDSNIKKQIIKYDPSGKPTWGLRFIYVPESGKLAYSRGRVFLIFSHYNFFTDVSNYGDHTGDTSITFNDLLRDLDFGDTWGASHSLIQACTFDEFYFWTAALADASPYGIKVEYISKRNISYNEYNSYDPVNKKYNLRYKRENDNLAGYIKGNRGGTAEGKLGGIMYFEKLKLYCLVYAKTPNYSNDSNNNKTIIYLTTWKFTNNTINSNITKEIKVFQNNIDVRVRGGKLGDDKVVIIYNFTKPADKGKHPNVFIIQLQDFSYIRQDVYYNDLFMNTCEDFKTFADGVLIWASSNRDGKLVINKIGKPKLDESYDDITRKLTIQDLIDYDNEMKEKNGDEDINSNPQNSKSYLGKILIGVGILIGVILLIIGFFIIRKCIKKRIEGESDIYTLKGPLINTAK